MQLIRSGTDRPMNAFGGASVKERISTFNRRRKWDMFMDQMRPSPDDTILDIGYTDLEYRSTDNLLEKLYPYRQKITALGVEEPVQFSRVYPDVRVVCYDGEQFPFEDRSFDVAWSNAVLEHVGTEDCRFERQVLFLREIARVARRAFVTTPNRWFPVEIHTRTLLLHWLPKRHFDRYLSIRGQDWAAYDYMTLLSEQELRRVIAAAGVSDYRLIKNHIGPFTADFVVIFD